MNGYSTYWRTTIFAAIAFHFLAALGFSHVLPHLMPEPKIEDAEEFEFVDVDLFPPDVVVIEAEAIPVETVKENLPTFKAQDLFVPEFNDYIICFALVAGNTNCLFLVALKKKEVIGEEKSL